LGIITGTESRNWAYLAMFRGAMNNVAYVFHDVT
jgi:hypothetical protein